MFILYLDCIRDVEQSEIKKVNIKSNKDKSTLIIIILSGLHLYISFAWKIKNKKSYWWCIKYAKNLIKKIRKCSNFFLANFGFVLCHLFLKLVLWQGSVIIFLSEITLFKVCHARKTPKCVDKWNNFEILNMNICDLFN